MRVAPGTTGGKTLLMIFPGTREMRQGVMAQRAVVPSIFP
jgi:hypothetical protein